MTTSILIGLIAVTISLGIFNNSIRAKTWNDGIRNILFHMFADVLIFSVIYFGMRILSFLFNADLTWLGDGFCGLWALFCILIRCLSILVALLENSEQ